MSLNLLEGPTLLPGEDHLELVRDSYYGMVEKSSLRQPTLRSQTARLQRDISAGVHALDAGSQNFIEVLTGKRLQQKAPPDREDLPPVDLPEPVVTGLTPDTVAIGQPSFDIHVMGSDFAEGAVIVFNGFEEPTTRVSETELTTGVNMDVWLGPSLPLPVLVRNPDGVDSNAMMFTFTAAAGAMSASAAQSAPSHGTPVEPKPVVKPKPLA